MIKEKVLVALNEQMNAELFSSYQYLAMAAFFEEESLSGFAAWMRMQSQEEYNHAMKIFDYIHQVSGKATLTEIKAPKTEWKTPLDVFADTYEHEEKVTKSIYELVDLSISEKDHATNTFLQWFVTEQVEEEATALKILDKIKMVGDNKSGLFLLDREMGQRAAAQ